MLTKLILRNFRGFENHELPLRAMTVIVGRSEEHTSELQSRLHLVCRLLLEKKKQKIEKAHADIFISVRHSTTTAAPIALRIVNRDWNNCEQNSPVQDTQ